MTNAVLGADLADAEAVYDSPEIAAQLQARSLPAMSDLPCLAEAIDGDVARRYHLMRVVRADPFGKALDRPDVAAGIARLHQLGATSLATDLLPEAHGIRSALDAARPEPATELARRPKAGQLLFDGEVTLDRPADAATVFQRVDASDRVVETVYLLPNEPLPAYEVRNTTRPILLGTAAGTGTVAAVLYGVVTAQAFAFDPSAQTDPAKAQAAVNRNAALFGTSVSLGAIAVGSFAGALFLGG